MAFIGQSSRSVGWPVPIACSYHGLNLLVHKFGCTQWLRASQRWLLFTWLGRSGCTNARNMGFVTEGGWLLGRGSVAHAPPIHPARSFVCSRRPKIEDKTSRAVAATAQETALQAKVWKRQRSKRKDYASRYR